MKRYLLLSYLLISGFLASQDVENKAIPAGYYDGATGTGYTLKTQLKTIITRNHTAIGYSGLWTLYRTTSAFNDNWYEKDNTLLDIYSEIPNGADPYVYEVVYDQCGNYSKEGDCYNREHLIPQSVFNEAPPMVSDAFHIWPTDGYVNGRRGNFPFGKVGYATWTSKNGSMLGTNLNSGYSSGYSNTVFEPIDEFKGDIARAYFYFATRYEDQITSWGVNYDMFNKTKDQVFTDTFKNILLTWHTMDPVSDREIALNEVVYGNQNNRNPFIDHPEWVKVIWGSAMGTEDFNYQPREFLEVYPTLSSGIIYVKSKDIKAKILKVSVFNMNGVLVQSVNNPSKLSELSIRIYGSGVYIIKVYGNDFEVNRKVIIK